MDGLVYTINKLGQALAQAEADLASYQAELAQLRDENQALRASTQATDFTQRSRD